MSDMHEDAEEIEFPTAVCPTAEPHPRHLIPGTWRKQCPGNRGPLYPLNATKPPG